MENLYLTYQNTKIEILLQNFSKVVDGPVKSRHSGENRSPDGLQLLEKTGFLPDLIRDQPSSRNPIRDGMTENGILGLLRDSQGSSQN